jgi:hypothetical protein
MPWDSQVENIPVALGVFQGIGIFGALWRVVFHDQFAAGEFVPDGKGRTDDVGFMLLGARFQLNLGSNFWVLAR